MYVILNIHHETWHYPTEDNYEAASDRLKKVWTQIGNYFKDYDEHLIFEGLNEPRVIGTSEEWNGGSDATREVVNKLDADFVSTIRSLDGNNKLRHLMIPGYAASSSEVALKALKIPENDDKLIVSVHAYIPYNFALSDNKRSNKWVACKEGFTNDIDNLADMLKTLFTDKGQAVIIGEFGARSKDNDKYRAEWAKYYVTKMKTVGVPCVWWDNGAFLGSGELFGLFDRRNLEWRYPLVKDALISASNGEYTVDGLKSDTAILDELKRTLLSQKQQCRIITLKGSDFIIAFLKGINMRIITVDLHRMTKDEARNKLVMTIRNAPQGSVELRVTHGCNNGNVLQQMVRREFKSPRIDYIQPVLANDGQTLIFLK